MSFAKTIALSMAVLTCACSTTGGGMTRARGGLETGRPGVTVENTTGTALRVWVRASGNEILLGRVDGMRESSFNLPPTATGVLQLIVRPANARDGVEAHISQPFSVQENQRVTWELRAPVGTSVPRISTIAVFECADPVRC